MVMDSDAPGRAAAAIEIIDADIADAIDVADLIVTQVRDVGGSLVSREASDRLIIEEPLSIRLDETLVTTTMRTPGHDLELAVGFCFTEGLLHDAPVVEVSHCAGVRCGRAFGAATPGTDELTRSNTVVVRTGGRAPVPTPRLGTTSSSCGWCGSAQLEALTARLTPVHAGKMMDRATLMKVADRARAQQGLFRDTGASHGAAAFDSDANIVVLREDVGRHNAVDKVVGRLHLDGVTRVPADWGLFVSGRASIEMVQKAWAAGFGTLIAVSAPTALAVEAARRAGMTLAGFVRDTGFNIYAPAP